MRGQLNITGGPEGAAQHYRWAYEGAAQHYRGPEEAAQHYSGPMRG